MLEDYEIVFNSQNIPSKSFHSPLITLAGCLGPILIPPLHIFIVYNCWSTYNRVINKNLCSCSCWDSIFKGPYESGVASYKHVYFNSTSNTFKIWILTVVYVLLLYEANRRLVSLALQMRVRYSMGILFLSSMFPHYYSWWMFFNYWNDEYYKQWYHQLFFSLTELVSSVLVLILADRRVTFTAAKALPVVAVGMVHILASCWDQFIINVLQGKGYSYQIVRDIGFMVPDVLHVVVPFWQLKKWSKSPGQKDYVVLSLIVVLGLLILSLL